MKIAYCDGWWMLGEEGKFRSSLGFGSVWLHTAALILVVGDVSTHTLEIWALSKFYSARNGTFLLAFRDNLSVPSSRVRDSSWSVLPLKMGPIGCPQTSVRKCHSTLSKIPKERRSHSHRGGSLKVSCPSLSRKKCSKYQTELKPYTVILCWQAFQARFRKHSLEGERVRVSDQVCTPSTLAVTASESDCSHHILCENWRDY